MDQKSQQAIYEETCRKYESRREKAAAEKLLRIQEERAERAEQLTREALEESRRAYRQNRLLIIITVLLGVLSLLVEILVNFDAISETISKFIS